MNVALRPSMSREEFFLWAEAQEERYEFDGWNPVCMTGGTLGHSLLEGQLFAVLRARLAGSRFQVLGPNAGLATGGNRVRYPDAVVNDGPVRFKDRVVNQPVAAFEVLSPTSSRTDRIVKLREYGAVAGLMTYVILEGETQAATLFTKDENGRWEAQPFEGNETVPLAGLGIDLSLAEIYGGMFDPPADGP